MIMDVYNLIKCLNKDINYDEFSSFSFKILIKQLKTALMYSEEYDKENKVIKKFNEYIKSYSSLPTVKDDLKRVFNIDLERNTIEFDKSLQTGNKTIDDQHRHLIGIFNMIKSNNYNNTEEILKELSDYANYHFSTEEDLFRKYNYLDTENHVIEHKEYVNKINKFMNKYFNNEISIDEIDNFLTEWIIVHIKYSDQAYARYFKGKGIFE